jgi:proteasome accessory factor A
MEPCPKILGADFELANALLGRSRWFSSAGEAARLLLEEIPGFPLRRWGGSAIEWDRRFLSTSGGSAYIDSDHLEINLPEHARAADHAALIHAGLRVAHEAQRAASARLTDGERLSVLAAVSDGRESWGHHLNVMVTRELFDGLFLRKPHLASFVGTHLATATIFAGHGQVGAGNDRPACDYQLSQRADWFEEFIGHQTMMRRPLLNQRDEPHAGADWARLHIIFFDNVLSPYANFLKAGTTQLVLALAEAGWVDPDVLLDDPLAAAHCVSRDLSLREPLRLAQRRRTRTAVEVQQGLAELAAEFVAGGQADSVVPGAAAIVACWRETLEILARRDLDALAGRCDWALKYLLLDRQRGRRGLSWRAPEMKQLDLVFSSVDPEEGLFWKMAAAGRVEGMPTSAQVERFVQDPPDDTRAYLRAHLLRRWGDDVSSMDWDHMRFRRPTKRSWYSEATLAMPDPAGFTREVVATLLDECGSLNDLLEALADPTPAAPLKMLACAPSDSPNGPPSQPDVDNKSNPGGENHGT